MIGVHIHRRQDTQSGQRDDGPRATGVALVLVILVVGPWRGMLLLGARLPPRRLRRGYTLRLGGCPHQRGGPRREGRREERPHHDGPARAPDPRVGPPAPQFFEFSRPPQSGPHSDGCHVIRARDAGVWFCRATRRGVRCEAWDAWVGVLWSVRVRCPSGPPKRRLFGQRIDRSRRKYVTWTTLVGLPAEHFCLQTLRLRALGISRPALHTPPWRAPTS